MAFERIKTVKGKQYRYIVENIRTGGKVQQKTIKYLGRVTEESNKEAVEILNLLGVDSISKRERQNVAKLKTVIDKIEKHREMEESCIKEVNALLRKKYPSCGANEKYAKHALKFELSQGNIRTAKAMVNTGRLVYISSW